MLLQNFNSNTNNPFEADRNQRQQILRLGLIICLILVFIDGGNRQENRSNSSSLIPIKSTYNASFVEQLNSKLKVNFQRNVSGIYFGSWNTLKSHNLTVAGKVAVQLKSIRFPHIPALDFVHGVLKVYGVRSGQSTIDLLLPLQGVFAASTGNLILFSTPLISQKLFIDVVDDPFHQNEPFWPLSEKKMSGVLNSSVTNTLNFSQTGKFNFLNQSTRFLDDYSAVVGRGVSITVIDTLDPGLNSSQAGTELLSLLNSAPSSILSTSFRALLLERSRYPLFANATIDNPFQCQFVGMFSSGSSLAQNSLLGGDYNNSRFSFAAAKDTSADAFAQALSGTLSSSNCNVSYNISVSSFRLQKEMLEKKAEVYSGFVVFVCFAQIILIVAQLRYAQNQAAASKISIAGISMQALLDAVLCIFHMLLSAAVTRVLYLSYLVLIALLKLIIFGVFEMKVMTLIYQARYAQSIADQGPHGMRRVIAALNIRFFSAFFVLMITVFYFRNWPVLLCMILYSYMVPQIVYSAWSGTRKAFCPTYLVGTAISRLFIPLYFLGCPRNFIWTVFSVPADFKNSSTVATLVLVAWTAAQVAMIFLQDSYGPRFFVPKQYLPFKYDYRRKLPRTVGAISPDVEAGGLPECAICFNGVEDMPEAYMITPCDHVFHPPCLTRWIEVKLECPVCRATLPPVDDA